MGFLDYLIFAYLGTAAMLALRYGWYMRSGLDKYDWRYRKFNIWANYVMSVIFWPMTFWWLLKWVIDPKELFNPADSFNQADRHRNLDRFWANPPPCGRSLKFNSIVPDESCGIFTFATDDVLGIFPKECKIRGYPYEYLYAAIQDWLANCDRSIEGSTDVPDEWEYFHEIADYLLRHHLGTAYCTKCESAYSATDIETNDDHGKPGWNYRRIICPINHVLLCVDDHHVFVRRGDH